MLRYDWNFARLLPYWRAFLSGTMATLSLTLLVVVAGTLLGVLLGLALRGRITRILLYPAIDVIRALPPIVLILLMYYLLTEQVIGTAVQAYWVCAIAMTLNLAAFTSDLVRAAISNVPRGSLDAGKALGLSDSQLTRHIVLPHVLREVVPGMTVLYIGMLKMSSLASIIHVREVVYTAQTVVAEISRSLEAWTVVGAVYILLVLPASHIARRVEAWSRRSIGGVVRGV